MSPYPELRLRRCWPEERRQRLVLVVHEQKVGPLAIGWAAKVVPGEGEEPELAVELFPALDETVECRHSAVLPGSSSVELEQPTLALPSGHQVTAQAMGP